MERNTVYLGVLLVELSLPWASSLKEKRSQILPVTEKLKSRFPVSVARLDGLNEHGWELVGVSALSNDRVWLEGMLTKALEFVTARDLQVSHSQLDIEVWEVDS